MGNARHAKRRKSFGQTHLRNQFTHQKVTEDISDLKLNTAIASLMSFVKLVKTDGFITRDEYKIFLTLLNPLAPHITSEIYEIVFGENIVDAQWPQYDEKYLEKDETKLPIQINGKMKNIVLISRNATQNEVIEKSKQSIQI